MIKRNEKYFQFKSLFKTIFEFCLVKILAKAVNESDREYVIDINPEPYFRIIFLNNCQNVSYDIKKNLKIESD